MCRRRKVRCLGGSPCANCLRSRKKEACVYEDEQSRASQMLPHRTPTQAPETPSSASNYGNTPISLSWSSLQLTRRSAGSPSTSSVAGTQRAPAEDIDAMKARIRQLEERIYKTSPGSSSLASAVEIPSAQIETATTQLGGTFHIHHPSPNGPAQRDGMPGPAQVISRNISHKTRYFGQSHWVTTIAPLVS